MLLDPVIGVLLCCCYLHGGKTRCQDCHAVLAGLISAALCQYRPIVGLLQIRSNAAPCPIVSPKRGLRDNVTSLRSLGKPPNSFRVVLLHFMACRVSGADRKLRGRVSLFGDREQAL